MSFCHENNFTNTATRNLYKFLKEEHIDYKELRHNDYQSLHNALGKNIPEEYMFKLVPLHVGKLYCHRVPVVNENNSSASFTTMCSLAVARPTRGGTFCASITIDLALLLMRDLVQQPVTQVRCVCAQTHTKDILSGYTTCNWIYWCNSLHVEMWCLRGLATKRVASWI